MTPIEFKSWFSGFVEAFDGKEPSKKQWARIKERVAEIDGKAITERVFVDRWWPYVHHYSPWYSISGGSPSYITTSIPPYTTTSIQNAQNLNVLNDGHIVQNTFDVPLAMYALGKADAASLSTG